MNRENHLKVDKFFWDKEFWEVHSWLDEFHSQFVNSNPYRHWLKRHHLKAIKEEYGNYTNKYNVAYLHILSDFLSHFGVAAVPEDEKDVSEWLKTFGML